LIHTLLSLARILIRTLIGTFFFQRDDILTKIDIESLTVSTQRVILNAGSGTNLEMYLEIIKGLKALEATPANYQIALDTIVLIAEKGI